MGIDGMKTEFSEWAGCEFFRNRNAMLFIWNLHNLINYLNEKLRKITVMSLLVNGTSYAIVWPHSDDIVLYYYQYILIK